MGGAFSGFSWGYKCLPFAQMKDPQIGTSMIACTDVSQPLKEPRMQMPLGTRQVTELKEVGVP